MKNTFRLMSAVLVCLALTACGKQPAAELQPSAEPVVILETTPMPTPTPEPTPEPTPVPTPKPSSVVALTSSANAETVEIDRTASELDLPGNSYLDSFIEQAESFTSLTKIRLGTIDTDLDTLNQIHDLFPSAIVTYSIDILGKEVAHNASTLDISSGSSSQVPEICEALKMIPAVYYIEMTRPDGTSGYTLEDLSALSEACPGASLHYSFELFEQTISTTDERVEYKNADIGNGGLEEIRAILPYMKNLNYLLLDDCHIDYDLLAQLRDDYPEIKVVWRVYFSGDGYNVLTDTEKIWATGSVTDGYTDPLKYCTEVKYMDLGHNCITHINFVNNMPKLEVLVIAITWVKDLSPLANCPNLEYLECFTSYATDITPLANCKNLRHLNISNLASVNDISCLYDLPSLERLYCTMSYIPQEQQDKIKELMPNTEFVFSWTDPSKGPWRYDDNGDRVPRYELLAQQFGYDTFEYSR